MTDPRRSANFWRLMREMRIRTSRTWSFLPLTVFSMQALACRASARGRLGSPAEEHVGTLEQEIAEIEGRR